MNAQDNDLDLSPRDGDLLAGIDRALAHPEAAPHGEPASFEEFCAHLATATPAADPAFRNMLARRLGNVIEQRRESAGLRARLRSSLAHRSGVRASGQAPRWRVASLILAVLVAGGGAGVYLHGQGATPVDAQTVLHRAAAVTPGPNEATHATYRVLGNGSPAGTADVWVGYDKSGQPTELALTFKASDGTTGAIAHMDAAGLALARAYDPAGNPILNPLPAPPAQGEASNSTVGSRPILPAQVLKGMLVGTLLAQRLSAQPDAFALQRETIDGVAVYALKRDEPASQTFYFNAQTYVLEGVDWVQDGNAWQVRLDPASYRTMPLSAVPANTFPTTTDNGQGQVVIGGKTSGGTTQGPGISAGGSAKAAGPGIGVSFSASSGGPSGTTAQLTITVAISGLKGSGVDLMPAMLAACKTNASAFAAAVQKGDRSMLAVCQETNPGMTADQLVTALLAPVKSALDAQVTSGAITSDKESSELANVRTQLTHLVTSGIGIGRPGLGAGFPQP